MSNDANELTTLQKALYSIYEKNKNFLAETRKVKMNYDEFLFLQSMHAMCDRFDSIYPNFFKQWMDEYSKTKGNDDECC